MVRQRGIDNLLHRLQIKPFSRPGTPGRQRDHQRIDVHQRVEVLGITDQLRLQAQRIAVDPAHPRRLHAILRSFTAGDLPASRRQRQRQRHPQPSQTDYRDLFHPRLLTLSLC